MLGAFWSTLPPSLKTLWVFFHELRVITFPIDYHWKCVRRPFFKMQIIRWKLKIPLGNRAHRIQHASIMLKRLVPHFYPKMHLDDYWRPFFRNPSRLMYKSAPRSRQITTPAPHHSVFTGRMPFLTLNQQRQSTKGTKNYNHINDNITLLDTALTNKQTLQAPVSIKPMVFCHPPCISVHPSPRWKHLETYSLCCGLVLLQVSPEPIPQAHPVFQKRVLLQPRIFSLRQPQTSLANSQ